MIDILDAAIKATVTAAASALFAAICVWIKGRIKRDRIYDKVLKALAHDSYFRQCRYILPEPNMSEDELENLNYLRDAYKSLGLNGTGDELYRRCLEKPIRKSG